MSLMQDETVIIDAMVAKERLANAIARIEFAINKNKNIAQKQRLDIVKELDTYIADLALILT